MMKKKTTTKSKSPRRSKSETPEEQTSVEPEQAPVLDETVESDSARIIQMEPHADDSAWDEEPGASDDDMTSGDTPLIIEAVTELYANSDGGDSEDDEPDDDEFVAEEGYGEIEEQQMPAASEVTDSAPQVMSAQVNEFVFQAPSEEEPESLPLEIEEETAEVEEMGEGSLFQTPNDMKGALECVFFTTTHPLSLARLRAILGKVDIKTLRGAVSQLQAEYDARSSGLQIMESSEGFQMCTRPQYADAVLRLHKQRKKNPLSMTALETLAIVAYKQPITRAEIEMIRGVESSGVLRNLLDMGLVRVVGRKEVIGRPQLYGTTNVFLSMFGLKSNQDLPPINELRKRFSTTSLLTPSAPLDEEPTDAVDDSAADASAETEEAAVSEEQTVVAENSEQDAAQEPPRCRRRRGGRRRGGGRRG